MIICLKCNRQMIKTDAVEFITNNGYWLSALMIECPVCGDKVAENFGNFRYDPERAREKTLILEEI